MKQILEKSPISLGPSFLRSSYTTQDQDDIKATLERLDQAKQELLENVDKLLKLKESLYKNVDIETPMSEHEKNLNREINVIFSEINKIIKQKRTLAT